MLQVLNTFLDVSLIIKHVRLNSDNCWMLLVAPGGNYDGSDIYNFFCAGDSLMDA